METETIVVLALTAIAFANVVWLALKSRHAPREGAAKTSPPVTSPTMSPDHGKRGA